MILAVFHSDAHAAQDVRKGNVGNGQRGARARNCQRIRILLRIGGHDHGDDLRLIHEPVREQRTNGTIDQAAGENFFFGGTPLAFDKPARNLSGGVSVFPIIYREREKSGPGFGLIGHTGGDQHNGITRTNDDRAVRLFGHLTRFQGNLTATQVNFNCVRHFLKILQRPGTGPGQSRMGDRWAAVREWS